MTTRKEEYEKFERKNGDGCGASEGSKKYRGKLNQAIEDVNEWEKYRRARNGNV